MFEVSTSLHVGGYMDWLHIKSDKIKSLVDTYWKTQHIIPKIVRTTGLQNISSFCWGANLACHEETSNGKCLKTYVNERDLRLLLMHSLAFHNEGYKLIPEPIYNPDEVNIQPLDYPPIHNKIRAKKLVEKAKGVKITSTENNWAPIVNLSLIN